VEDFRLDRADAMEKMLAPYPVLFLTGSAYRGVGVPDCIYQAVQTDERVLASLSHPLRRETHHRPDCA
jgi:oxygen-dependent protoporphyrinogen oxidase